jgi:hypothetical protein
MWLNGFNDNSPGYPLVECERVKCPEPYMGAGQPNAPPDPSKGKQDPFGLGGESYVEYGTCPRGKPFDNEDEVMTMLAAAKLNSFDKGTHGQFFWNFRTEFEPRWDFQEAVKRGWIPRDLNRVENWRIVDMGCPPHLPGPPRGPGSGPFPLFDFLGDYGTIAVIAVLLLASFGLGTYCVRKRSSHHSSSSSLLSNRFFCCRRRGYERVDDSGNFGAIDLSASEGSMSSGDVEMSTVRAAGERMPHYGTSAGHRSSSGSTERTIFNGYGLFTYLYSTPQSEHSDSAHRSRAHHHAQGHGHGHSHGHSHGHGHGHHTSSHVKVAGSKHQRAVVVHPPHTGVDASTGTEGSATAGGGGVDEAVQTTSDTTGTAGAAEKK